MSETPQPQKLPRTTPPVQGETGAPDLAESHFGTRIGLDVVSLRSVYRTDSVRGDEILDAYYPGYAKAFPDPNERRSKERCREFMLRENANEEDMTIVFAGGKIVGGAHHCLIHGDKAMMGLLGYIWVADEARRMGIASFLDELVCNHAQKKGCLGVLTPVNDPSRMTPAAKEIDAACGIDPEMRLNFWNRRERLAFDAPYLLPPLDEQSDFVPHLMMTARWFSVPPNGFPKEEYLALLRGIFVRFTDPLQEPAYRETEQRLVGREFVGIIPLSEQRTIA